MTIIVAADNDWAIGKNGKLLAHLPADMKFFRETTTGKVVVMGRKTWDGLSVRPLPGRANCVLSRTIKQLEGAQVFSSVEEAPSDAFIIGGGEIYAEFLPYCNEALVTRVYESFGGDTFFPNLDELPEWEIAETSPVIETNGYNIRFFKYVRR